MATASQLIRLAASQIGVKEEPAGSNRVKYWDYYKEKTGCNWNGGAWCAAFVTWCMSKVGAWSFTKDEGRFRYCPDLVNWAKNKGQWVDRSKGAKIGDIILFGNGKRACHVGIVEKVIDANTVQTIEGNTSLTSNDNGGSVMRRTRKYGTVGSNWYIMGFVRTPWDEWKKDSKGWWLKYPDGSWPKNKWVKLDAWYYFNNEGYALENTWKKIGGYWYWFNKDCRMVTGWIKLKDLWYYLSPVKKNEWPEGSARTGWAKVDGKWYYFNMLGQGVECSMRTGWLTWNGNKYYLKPKKANGKDDGSMAVNETLTIDGKVCKFDGDGRLV